MTPNELRDAAERLRWDNYDDYAKETFFKFSMARMEDVCKLANAYLALMSGPCERGRLWVFIRDAMMQGIYVNDLSKSNGEGYERFSARMDAEARKFADKFLDDTQ